MLYWKNGAELFFQTVRTDCSFCDSCVFSEKRNGFLKVKENFFTPYYKEKIKYRLQTTNASVKFIINFTPDLNKNQAKTDKFQTEMKR